ncbi:PREDICTED: serine carboxypeptidase-like 7 [Ipomoea nil]|uniref:serine carboxypeptidase-like 7 n=1 Tax=Ipomoea nil TaxID=35883 RepID=UPI000901C23D|nr:PREDICTED: serine carboxypeptidase-like 7 [Ipomoea nil]
MFSTNLLRRRCCTSLSLLLGTIVVFWFSSSQFSVALAAAGSKVEYLPGFGPLPFELETGYVGVGESEDVQLFYYFVKSESNPSIDPIVLWISGGPGCSSLFALAEELGPLTLDVPKNNLTLPTLSLNPYSWTKVASFIYLDLPVGTGFSYAKSSKNYTSNSIETSIHAAEFLRKWLADHFEYQSNSFYVGGDSFSGMTVPTVVQEISYGIEARFKPLINLKGYLIGNGFTFRMDHYDYVLRSARGFSIIPDELYQSIEKCGGGTAPDMNYDLICQFKVGIFLLLSGVNFGQNVLETNCYLQKENVVSSGQSSVAKRFRGFAVRALDRYFVCNGPKVSSRWANDGSVQAALHVRKGSIEEWVQCRDDLPYHKTVFDTRPYHAILSQKGYRSLVYSGDGDLYVPSLSAEAWTKLLNYPIIDDWRSWFVNNQVAGYTRTFSNNMTYAKIKGSAHIAPMITPLECLVMFKRWISYEKL